MMKRSPLAAAIWLSTSLLSNALAQAPESQPVPQIKPPLYNIDGGPAGTSALPNRALRTSDITGRNVYSSEGQQLGSVKRVVLNATDGTTILVLEYGGLMGLGEREFPLPVERVFLQDGRLVSPDLTQAELRAASDWDAEGHNYRNLANSTVVNIARR